MRHLIKDKKVKIYELQTVKVNGVNTKTYVARSAAALWAHYQQQAGGGASLTDSNGLQVYDSTERAVFTINYRPDLTIELGDLVVFRSKFYNVIIVDDFQGYHEHLKITAELADSQDAAKYPGVEL